MHSCRVQMIACPTVATGYWCSHSPPGLIDQSAELADEPSPCHLMGMTLTTTSDRPRAAQGCGGGDPLEAAAVRAGWLLVDAYERLGSREAREVFGPSLDAWFEHSRATVADLRPWKSGLATFKVNENDNNRLRHRRTLDMVREGETVFDVGFGKGYLCGLLLRDRAVAAYHGIDVVAWHHKQVTKVLDANDLPKDNVHVNLGDLYELQRETVEATGATVVTCCEVLEHVPEPRKALRVLADALPHNADLVFSVPMYGRIENVWGHCTTFDSTRLKEMCEDAGLYVHHVEPVANVWTFVVASRRPEPSSRVQHALTQGLTSSPSIPLADTYNFVPVEQSQMTLGKGVRSSTCDLVPAPKGDVRCDVRPDRLAVVRSSGRYAGVTVPVRGLTSLRVRLGLPDGAPVSEVVVEAHAGSGGTARWLWRPKPAQLMEGKTQRWAFRLGQDTVPFSYRGPSRTELDVDRVQILVRVASAESLSFTVGAAYVPARTAGQAG
jgi:2-polyprenyl-3-methyl-5-hydroxy-6-metoxy-1,4-benzoquinol methylase